ncbi:MAG: peptidoglycan DD-metalloendopeptidase family protein [Pseudomonadota bacterium]
MQRRIAQCLLPVLLLSLSACSGLMRWGNEPAQRTSSPGRTPATQVRRSDGDSYTVRPGDTLYSIAFRNQIDYHDLASWNGIDSDFRIIPGRVLRLKPRAERPVAKPVPVSPPVSRPQSPVEAERVASKPVPSVIVPASPSVIATPSAPVATPVFTVPPSAASSGFEWFWPTTGTILKTYAPQAGFKGLDFGGNFGQPVFAAAPGRVVYSGNALKGYGELIIIKHNDTYLSAYSYNRHRNVNEGDVVTAGQPIGELGNGPENKPFLHFEIRERGQPVDPMRFLPKRETTPGAKLSGN